MPRYIDADAFDADCRKMRDYADIISQIRIAAIGVKKQSNRLTLMQDAADAIEEQSKRADELGEELTSAMELVHKRNEKIEKLQSELVTIRNKLPKHGEWIEVAMRIKCSVCGTDFNDEVTCCSDCYRWPWNYCPNCGARLEVSGDV